jgi:hypothetical protein
MPRHSSVDAPGRPSRTHQRYHTARLRRAGETLNFQGNMAPQPSSAAASTCVQSRALATGGCCRTLVRGFPILIPPATQQRPTHLRLTRQRCDNCTGKHAPQGQSKPTIQLSHVYFAGYWANYVQRGHRHPRRFTSAAALFHSSCICALRLKLAPSRSKPGSRPPRRSRGHLDIRVKSVPSRRKGRWPHQYICALKTRSIFDRPFHRHHTA